MSIFSWLPAQLRQSVAKPAGVFCYCSSGLFGTYLLFLIVLSPAVMVVHTDSAGKPPLRIRRPAILYVFTLSLEVLVLWGLITYSKSSLGQSGSSFLHPQTIWRCPVWGMLVRLGETEASLPSHLISCNCAKMFSDYFLFTGSDWHSANPNPFLWLQGGGWASADVTSTTNRHIQCLTSLCCSWSSSSTSTVCKMKWDRKCVWKRARARD